MIAAQQPFLLAFPEVKLDIVSDDGMVDIVAEGFDAGIRAGQQLAPDMISIPVGPALRFAVVGPADYFASHTKPERPGDLLNHACIGRRYPGGAPYAWAFGRGEARMPSTSMSAASSSWTTAP